ncbi:Gramicidin S biosynthesis protein GrsT [Symbiodinium microadriaticum]|uniref:Gramicidin S biosynthesis protein GrsT n=1 Tax=Symbiodinium microadriaticum TaxID=2951 RepID=A0A1Q9C3P7_SYMMI|nr:Gramicidin S biosynthesis protein GrsT [Symbiodinium microadriaticum]
MPRPASVSGQNRAMSLKVEELKLVGERLHYKRLTGTGPEEGWISLKVSGKELVVRKDEDDTPPEDVGGPGDAAGAVETDAALKSKLEADSKAKKDEGALLLYCMKYKVLGFPLDKPKLRILCFHNAGSAESIYTGPGTPFISWIKESKQIELLAFDYPGRDKLLKATKHTSTETLAPDLLAVAHEKLTDGVPYLVWGHSVGTWVGFEFLMLCRKVGIPMPLAAFFVTFPAPHYPEAKRPWRRNARLSDSQFQEEVKAWDKEHFGGAAKVVFEESWKDTWEPMMRADFKLFDEYKFRHAGAPKFDFPLHCWWCEGEHFIKPEMVQAWKDWTAGPFDYQELKGAGHLTAFYKPDLKKAYFTKVTDLMKNYAGLHRCHASGHADGAAMKDFGSIRLLATGELTGQRYGETPYKLYESTDGLTREQREQAPYFFVWLHGMDNGPIAPKNLQTMQARLQRRVIFMAPQSPTAKNELRFDWGCCYYKTQNKNQLGYVFGSLHQEFLRDFSQQIGFLASLFQAERTLVMGYSMGGFGAFQVGGFSPATFDAVVSVAGYGLGTLEEGEGTPQPEARERFEQFLDQVATRLSDVPVVLALHAQKDGMSSFTDVSAIIDKVKESSQQQGKNNVVELYQVPDGKADSDKKGKKQHRRGHHYFNYTLLDGSSEDFFWANLRRFLAKAERRGELSTVTVQSRRLPWSGRGAGGMPSCPKCEPEAAQDEEIEPEFELEPDEEEEQAGTWTKEEEEDPEQIPRWSKLEDDPEQEKTGELEEMPEEQLEEELQADFKQLVDQGLGRSTRRSCCHLRLIVTQWMLRSGYNLHMIFFADMTGLRHASRPRVERRDVVVSGPSVALATLGASRLREDNNAEPDVSSLFQTARPLSRTWEELMDVFWGWFEEGRQVGLAVRMVRRFLQDRDSEEYHQ